MILEHSEDEYRTPRARLFSLLMSLAMHAVLTLILWSLVYGINLPTSIQLTASLSDPNTATVSISETIQPADRSIVDAEEPATPTDSTVEYSLLEILASKDAKVVDHSIDSEEIQDGPDPISVVEFFGIRDIGTKFVFVVDISYSMQARNGERFQRAMSELVRAVSNLNPQQSYYVYLFSWRTHGMYYDQTSGFIRADPNQKTKLQRWIMDINLGSGTDPRRALSLARNMEPDAIFLLSDGQFNHPNTPFSETGWLLPDGTRSQANVEDGIARLMESIPVHAISFENPFTKDSMAKIAELSGGEFRYIKTQSHQPLDPQRFLNAVKTNEDAYGRNNNLKTEYRQRMSMAREFMTDGELAFAEYIIRPLRHADPSQIDNPILCRILLNILDEELGAARLEDFGNAAEVKLWLQEHRP